ncbi:hypothetical protein [Butyrivibrio sp. LC3010]|uniref:hypothetical protein n=1 Tax=Butyrivibrio sp. LC3010 TaxID=1280680 RepID=UPI00042998AA|nr:hypothetical protein [Butyrivibrio sp. LC3010]
MKKRIYPAVLTLMIAFLFIPVSVKAANVTEAMYTDGFEKASDYDKYAAGDKSLIDTNVWVEGDAKGYDEASNSIIIKTDSGNWSVYCGKDGTESFKELIKQVPGKKIRVFGKYQGIDESLNIPRVNFLYDNVIEAAYRLESTDNDFRISYLDYAIGMPDLDTEKTYYGMNFKSSSSFTQKGDSETDYYYFDAQTPAFIMLHAEDLSDPVYKSYSEDTILDTFVSVYTDNNDTVFKNERTNIGGMRCAIVESTFSDEKLPCSMSLYSVMAIANDHCYYLGCTQPYLSTETFKSVIPAMLENVSFQNEADSTKLNADNEGAEKIDEAPADDKTADTAGTDKTALEEPLGKAGTNNTEGETEKKDVPTKAEVVGLYTMTLELVHGSGQTTKDTGENLYFGEKDLTNYDETTGVCTVEEENFSMVLTFEYDKDRRIMCHGSVTSGDNVGSIIGLKTS